MVLRRVGRTARCARWRDPGPLLRVGEGDAGAVTKGFVVTGLDANANMLRRANLGVSRLPRFCRPNARFVHGDMRSFDLAETFDMVICAFNSLEHLYNDADVLHCLRRAHNHLKPDGLLALDVEVPDLEWLRRDPDKRWSPTRFRHPSTRQWLRYTTNHSYDERRQIAHIRFFYTPLEPGPLTEEQVVHLTQRKFDPEQLRTLLDEAGFQVLRHDADFEDAPVHEDAIQQVVVCRLAGSDRRL